MNARVRKYPFDLAVMGLVFGLGMSVGCGRQPPPASSHAVSKAPAATITLVPMTNMVAIKAGSFLRIRFPVTLTRDYWLGKYEVTQAEFQAVMGRNPSHYTGDSNRPVEKVSHLDAQKYCAILTQREREARRLPPELEYRLPTEAEWEYACRAGTTNLFSFGDDSKLADRYAWTAENCKGTTHSVGQKQPNPWGLFDMHGNVWEWCGDWYGPYPPAAVVDPVGPPTNKFKIFKGGGWNQDVEYSRSANRFGMAPANGIHFVGFRVALGPVLPQPAK